MIKQKLLQYLGGGGGGWDTECMGRCKQL